jgi:hypothetical protein
MQVVVPTPVIAEVSRSPRQAGLRHLLAGCETAPLLERAAHRAGALLGRAKTTDVVDATLVAVAVERGCGHRHGGTAATSSVWSPRAVSES